MKSLREWRMAAALSVMGLAFSAGVAPNTLMDIERGRRVPGYGTMRAISQALGVGPHDIAEFAAAIEIRSSVRDRESSEIV